jgi:DNA-binding phage protein
MNTQNWLRTIESFENSPQGFGFSLRADLSDIIARYLNERGITQVQLAAAAGMKPQQLSRIIHSSANSTLDTVGRILFALGTKLPKLTVDHESTVVESRCFNTGWRVVESGRASAI